MEFDLSGKRVAVLGTGKIGGILLKALLEKGLLTPQSTFATVQHEERARASASAPIISPPSGTQTSF
jgi:pyrroline-5-carboxylate reductase